MSAVRMLGVLACVALAGWAATIIVRDPTLHPSIVPMLVWFAGALLLHDLVLFPLYAAADRVLALLPATRVPLVNHVRIPLLGAGLTLLLYLPGIIRQGEPVVLGASGLGQEPFLARWLWLVLAMTAVSALVWVVRVTRRSAAGG
ncbi:MAG: hypothetical protein J0I34_00900 [Pseudonocardia sp.]|uniref:hypothetical protein n=1 Tax=unclassified Pseudonocardia TaxID=2619320 RepID=UPI00086D0CA9|nr:MULTISPECIES: hypothetical protein [unclassified Pseudonocardia]MBN9107314.1 hypothetical protein [Pseudonocardia sp.]ODV06564.1 MAG: hypothetical protein ABT15_12100 [Pseudonocardia sp. SCN 73-27]